MKDTLEISNAFNAHSLEYEQAAVIQKEIGERLFERLHLLKIQPKWVLDLGCGPGVFSVLLKKQYPRAQVVGLDLAHQMLQVAKKKRIWRRSWHLVNADMLALPFPQDLFDVIFANQVIHWSPSLPLLLRELNRVMRPGGCVMFSTLGPDTFQELRGAFSTVDAHAHVNVFPDLHDVGDALLAEYFLDPVVDMETLTAHYSSLMQLLRALKAQGVRNIHPDRPSGLTGKRAWHGFQQAMMTYKTSTGRFPLTYEVVYGHAWKGTQRRLNQGIETSISVSSLKQHSLEK